MSFDFADLKPSLLNWMVNGLMSVTFILFFKWLFSSMNIPGFSDAFASI
jgi:hypothetical protein